MIAVTSRRAIARHMCVSLWREQRLTWVFCITVFLSIVAGLHGSRQLSLFENARLSAEKQDRQTFVQQGERNPHSVAHFSRFAMRPALAATILDPGIRPYSGSAVWMEAHWQSFPNLRQAEDQVDLGRGIEVSAAWVVQIILPLLLILLGFDSVASERNKGTLVLLRGNGVSIFRMVFAKILALWLIACLLLCVVLAVSILAALVTDVGVGVGTDFFLRSLIWLLVNAIYLAIWSTLIVGFSLLLKPMMVFLMLIGIWVGMNLVLPRASAILADTLMPTPSAEAFANAIRSDIKQGIDGHNPSDARRKALEERVLKQYGVSKLEELPVSFTGIALQEGEEYSNQVFDQHFTRLNQSFLKKERIRRMFSIASPLVALQPISMSLADSGLYSHIDFMQRAESQRRQIVKTLNQDLIDNGVGKGFEYHADHKLWGRIPEYKHINYPIVKSLKDCFIDFGILLVWLLVSGLVLLRIVRREEAAQ